MRVVAALAVALLASVALSGCFDPHRVQVPAGALESSVVPWNVTKLPQEGKTFGTKSVETRYVHAPEQAPPYPGVLQVFSLRGDGAKDRDSLYEQAEAVITDAIAREGIAIDSSKDANGRRDLQNGLETRWFTHTGRIDSSSDDSIFLPGDAEHLVVQVHAEVGYDGRAKTGFIAVAFVQIGTHTESNLPGVIPPAQEEDLRTWIAVVADPDGSVDGASLAEGGLIYNLRTHG
ncbi:MAG: hypothetical protein ACPHID_03505 [Thermoplasmatota archaeon]